MEVILLHGLGQDASAWDKTVSALPEGIDAYCPELSELARGSYAELYSAFCACCEKRGGELNLCGLSLGAVLALNYAADFPERVRTLVPIAGQFKAPRALMRFQGAVFRVMPRSAFSGGGYGKEDFIALNDSMAGLDLTEKLSGIRAKTLVAVGERDKPNAKAARELSALLGCPLKTIPGSGHEINVDAPEALAETLAGFYEESGLVQTDVSGSVQQSAVPREP